MKVYKLLRAAICIVAALVPTFATATTASPEKDKVFLIDKYDGTDGTYIYETGGKLSVGASSTANAQYWRFIPTGTADRYYIQNVVTGNYIQSTSIDISTQVSTGTTPVEFQVATDNTSGATTNGYYYMCGSSSDLSKIENSGDQDSYLGLNNGNTNGVLAYYIKTDRGNSYWKLTDVTDSYSYNGSDALTSHTASAKVTYDGGTATSLTDQKVEVSSDGTKIIYRNFQIGNDVLGDFTVTGVTASTANGVTTYSLTNGSATLSNTDYNHNSTYSISEGATIPLAITGTLEGTTFKAQFTATVNGKDAVVLYNGYALTVTPTITASAFPTGAAINVIDENYNPNAKAYTRDNVSIDWGNQKLVASIDVSNCSNSYASSIFAIGENVSSSSATDIYIDYNSNSREIGIYSAGMPAIEDGDDGKSVTYNLFYKTKLASDATTIRVEISKEKGIYINDANCNYYSKSGQYTAIPDIATDWSTFWNLTKIQVGNKHASKMFVDKSTFNYVRILDKTSTSDDGNGTFVEDTPATFAQDEAENTDLSTSTITKYKDKYLSSLTLNRTLVANAWNTFCVPFNVNADGMTGFGEDFEIKKFKRVSDNSSSMLFENATSIEAGQPYLVRPKDNIQNPTFVYPQVTAVTPTANVGDDTFKFVGVYGKHTFASDDAATANSYILVTGGELVNPTPGTAMYGMRGYFTYTPSAGNAAAPRVIIDGVETALSEVVGSEAVSDGRIYNLRGMYVGNDASRLAKGIYIVNGKKVVLK